jgi:hypothetical protein
MSPWQASANVDQLDSVEESRMDAIRKLLDENAVLPLWPETGTLLKLKRGATYAAEQRGEIETITIGRLKRVPTAWLKRRLGITESGNGAD